MRFLNGKERTVTNLVQAIEDAFYINASAHPIQANSANSGCCVMPQRKKSE
jgi:hypothetical protein